MARTKKRRAAKPSRSRKDRDEYTVVLEDIRDQFRAFGEALDLEGEKGEQRGRKIDKLDAKVDKLDAKVDKLTVDMEMVKTELRMIRRDQVSREEFELLEKRVERL